MEILENCLLLASITMIGTIILFFFTKKSGEKSYRKLLDDITSHVTINYALIIISVGIINFYKTKASESILVTVILLISGMIGVVVSNIIIRKLLKI